MLELLFFFAHMCPYMLRNFLSFQSLQDVYLLNLVQVSAKDKWSTPKPAIQEQRAQITVPVFSAEIIASMYPKRCLCITFGLKTIPFCVTI